MLALMMRLASQVPISSGKLKESDSNFIQNLRNPTFPKYKKIPKEEAENIKIGYHIID
jgi:hypothetical protein